MWTKDQLKVPQTDCNVSHRVLCPPSGQRAATSRFGLDNPDPASDFALVEAGIEPDVRTIKHCKPAAIEQLPDYQRRTNKRITIMICRRAATFTSIIDHCRTLLFGEHNQQINQRLFRPAPSQASVSDPCGRRTLVVSTSQQCALPVGRTPGAQS